MNNKNNDSESSEGTKRGKVIKNVDSVVLPENVKQKAGKNTVGILEEKEEKSDKRKKIVLFVLLVFVLLLMVFFLLKYFKDRNARRYDQADLVVRSSETVVKTNEKKEEQKEKQTKKEFTEFGDFWIEINTDDLKIKAPIVEGVTDYKLSQGVGHHKTTARPNREKGNVVLSGHRWFDRDEPAFKVFENLDKLKIGDKIRVHYKGEDFVYEVFDTKIVPEDAVEILDQTKEPILTLYTCTPKHTAEKRLVFLARLVR